MGADQLRGLARTALALARPTPSFQLALAAAEPLVPAVLVGERFAQEMAAAAAKARDPLPLKSVEKALRDAWGAKPSDELDDLDAEPAAVTPTSQVHRGELDGAPVAVKVLRPGVAESRRNDLRVVDGLAAPLGAAVPALDVGRVLREVRERLAEELDLEHEGDASRRLSRALRDHPTLWVPMPVSRLTSERVLVAEWADGPSFDSIADRESAARAIVRFHVGSARFGFVHADPHTEHVIALDGGRFAFLDAGASRQVDAARVDLAVEALDALTAADGQALGRVLERLGWLPADAGPDALALAREIFDGFLDGPALLDVDAVVAVRDRTLDRLDAIAALALRTTVPAEDLWPLRMLGALGLVLAPLAVRADWPALLREAAVEGF
jgi:ubiquinone biosynthesis protein